MNSTTNAQDQNSGEVKIDSYCKQPIIKSLSKHLHKFGLLHLMALPTVILLIIFNYAPMFGIIMAFQNYQPLKGVLGSEFVGFKNFEFLFATKDVWIITRNTVCYNLVFIALNLVLAVALAILLNEIYFKKFAKVLQTIFIMPHFLSMAVVAILVMSFLSRNSGFVNQLLQSIGFEGNTDWYLTKSIWPPLLVFVNAWKGVGYSAVVYLACISGIPNEHYEAAIIDGASRRQQIRYITLPHLRTMIVILFIMSIGGIFRGDFGLFYTVTANSGALYSVTDVIDTYVFRALTKLNNIGMSTAAGLFQSVVGFILIVIVNKIVTKVDSDSALF